MKRNANWLFYVLLGVVVLWIIGEGSIYSYELPAFVTYIALGIAAYTFHLLKKDLLSQQVREPEVRYAERPATRPPTPDDFRKGTPFDVDFGKVK